MVFRNKRDVVAGLDSSQADNDKQQDCEDLQDHQQVFHPGRFRRPIGNQNRHDGNHDHGDNIDDPALSTEGVGQGSRQLDSRRS